MRYRTRKNHDKIRYLLRYRELMEKAKTYHDQAEEAQYLGLSSPKLSGMPKPTGVSTPENKYVKHMELAEQADRYAEQARFAMAEIERAIETVSDPEHRIMMRKRYIEGKEWVQISWEMNVSISQVFVWHGVALNEMSIVNHS